VKFTGQVRVPEIDHPGVPATILIEDDQAEVFLDGESLGRWSLFDVQASRLVSSAFSLSLHGEEITFIADEPVDFAYKGVDHMAESWARYKSMSVPRRVVAVGRSRRGTVPSRIGELRAAMLQNLEAAGQDVPTLAPIETVGRFVSEPATVATTVEVEPNRARVPHPFRRPLVEEMAPTADEPAAPPPRSPLRPGAGLLGTRVARPEEPAPEPDPDPVFAPPQTAEPSEGSPSEGWPSVASPSLSSPWDEPVGVEESVASTPTDIEERGSDHDVPEIEEARPAQTEAPRFDESRFDRSRFDRSRFDRSQLDESELDESQFEEPAEVSPPAANVVPELVKELLSTSSDEGDDEGARDLVVDLGQYEARRRGEGTAPEAPPTPTLPREPAMATVSTDAPERSGLLGAVRSAFARSKVTHEHQFVEAPGGIGIVRQICAECGYISIGLSD
jgi:hypothetical protein